MDILNFRENDERDKSRHIGTVQKAMRPLSAVVSQRVLGRCKNSGFIIKKTFVHPVLTA